MKSVICPKIFLILVKCKRIRYTGDCICRLPLIPSNNQNISEDAERVVIICNRCNKERIAIIDYVVFGTGLDDIVNQIRFEVEQLTGLTCSAGRSRSNGARDP